MKTMSRRAPLLAAVVALAFAVDVAPISAAQAATSGLTKSYNRALDADLVAAVTGNDVAKVRNLLSRNADPNARGVDWSLAPVLGTASRKGYIEIVRLLLEAGANLEAGNAKGSTPLLLAAENDRGEIIRYLLEKGARVDGPAGDSSSPLKTAAGLGNESAVRALLDGGADINSQKDGSLTPLMAACVMGKVDTVRTLLYLGANVHVRLAENETALMYSAQNTATGNLIIVKMLVNAGADVSVKAGDGKFIHEIAAENKLLDVDNYLRGIYNRDSELYNAANGASFEDPNAWSEMRAALDKGANGRFSDERLGNATALMRLENAHENFDETIVQRVIAVSDINAQSKDGRTVLMRAAEYRNEKLVALLLKNGASLTRLNKDGLAVRDLVIQRTQPAIYALLVAAGAKTSAELKASTTTSSTRSAPTPTQISTKAALLPYEQKPIDVELYDAVSAISAKIYPKIPVLPSDWDRVRKALDGGASGRYADRLGKTALTLLIASRLDIDVTLWKRIIAVSDVNSLDSAKQTPLHWASFGDNQLVVDLLLAAGAAINVLDRRGETPLDEAYSWANAAVISTLRKAGAKTSLDLKSPPDQQKPVDIELYETASAIRKKGDPNLPMAASDWERLRKVLDKGARGRYADKGGRTALTLISNLLLDADVATLKRIIAVSDVNAAKGSEKLTPLHIAASYGRLVLVDLLLAAGAEVNPFDSRKTTPLDIAEARKYADVITRLRAAGAKTSNELKQAQTTQKVDSDLFFALLDIKTRGGSAEKWSKVRQALLEGATSKNAVANGETSLMLLVTLDDVDAEIARQIFERADVDVQKTNGQSALHIAASRGSLPMIERLLQAGANVNALYSNLMEGKQTPLDRANSSKALWNSKIDGNAVIAALKNAGAKTYAELR